MPLVAKVGLNPSYIVLPSLPPKGHSPPTIFMPISIVAKSSPISATAEHLFSELVVPRCSSLYML